MYVFALNNTFDPKVHNIQCFIFKIWHGFKIDLFCLMEHLNCIKMLSVVIIIYLKTGCNCSYIKLNLQ